MKKIIFLALIIPFFCIQCKTQKSVELKQEERAMINVKSPVEVVSEPDFSIKSASIEGDLLKLSVTLTGEKGKHEFDLLWDGSIMKSLPPKVILHPVHKSSDVKGNKEVKIELVFNLTILKESLPASESVVVIINGHEESFMYQLR